MVLGTGLGDWDPWVKNEVTLPIRRNTSPENTRCADGEPGVSVDGLHSRDAYLRDARI